MGRVSDVGFPDHPAAIFSIFLGYPAVISKNISDHPVAISARQRGRPPTLQSHFSRVPYGDFFNVNIKIEGVILSNLGGWKNWPPRNSRLFKLWYHPTVISDIFADHPTVISEPFPDHPAAFFFRGVRHPPHYLFKWNSPYFAELYLNGWKCTSDIPEIMENDKKSIELPLFSKFLQVTCAIFSLSHSNRNVTGLS